MINRADREVRPYRNSSKMSLIPHYKKALIFTAISALSLSIMAVFVKLALPETTTSMVILFRFSVGLLYVFLLGIFQRCRGDTLSLKAKAPFKIHLVRALTGVMAMMCFYSTFRFLSVTDGTLIMMTGPLFLPLFTFLIYRQRTHLQVIFGILLGFLGLILILRPDSGVFQPRALIGLAGGAFAALALMSLTRATRDDSPFTILIYYFPMAVILSGVFSIFNWEPLTEHVLELLLGVGFFGTIYQDCLVRASQYAPPTLVSTVMYISIIFSGCLDWILWRDVPSLISLMGMLVVCSSGTWIVLATKKCR